MLNVLIGLASAAALTMATSTLAAGAEVTAASPSVADIQAAVDQVVAAGGGVARVPAGKAEAVGTVVLPGGVRLLGAGRERTTLFRGPQTGPKDSAPIVRVDGSNGRPVQIAGINFVGVLDPASNTWDSAVSLRDCIDFRVDHCRFQRFGSSAVHVGGRSRGVVDHCLFVDNFKKAINNVGYGVVVMGTGDWRKEARLGSADAVFIEDCELIGSRHAVASNGGAHRLPPQLHYGNDSSQAIDAHGPGYGSSMARSGGV